MYTKNEFLFLTNKIMVYILYSHGNTILIICFVWADQLLIELSNSQTQKQSDKASDKIFIIYVGPPPQSL